nr:hypothetical protein [uncultured Pseudomonas sp.]
MTNSHFDVPLYKDWLSQIASFLRGGGGSTLPFLKKSDLIQAMPHGFMTLSLQHAVKQGKVEYANTSGSSSMLTIIRPAGWWGVEFAAAYSSLPEMAGYQIASHRKAVLSTPVCSASSCRFDNPSFKERNTGGVLNLNMHPDPNQWTLKDIERIDRELHEFAPSLLEVNPSYLAIFLKKRNHYGINRSLFNPKWITSSYELMTRRHQEIIEAAYSAPIMKMYGSTELGVLFIQNSQGKFLHHTQNHILELRPVFPLRRIYEIIVTSWKNPFMPLLRYSTGDLVQVEAEQDTRGTFTDKHPLIIERLHGRLSDMVKLSNGEILTATELDDKVFRSLPTAFQYEYHRCRNNMSDCIHAVSISHDGSVDPTQGNIPDTISIQPGYAIPIKWVHSLAPQVSGKFVSIR